MENAKRRRLWNPAVEVKEERSQEMATQQNEMALAFQQFVHQMSVVAPPPPLPFLLHLQMAPLVAMRTLQHQQAPSPPIPSKGNSQALAAQQLQRRVEAPVPSVTVSSPRESPLSSSCSLTPPPSLKETSTGGEASSPSTLSPPTPSLNPLVQYALGLHVPNENCCAICGQYFRLTTDLVNHMRNNHRTTKFKRKNQH